MKQIKQWVILIKVFSLALILVVLLVGCATMTPLTQAAKDGDLATIDKLLREGANINDLSPGASGTTALGWALQNCKFDTASALLTKGANVNLANGYGAPIWFAPFYYCKNMERSFTNRLLQQVADVNIQDKQGNTIFSWLNYNEDDVDKVAKLLIDKGLNVNSKEGLDSPLIYAVGQDSVKLVNLLLDEGANINALGLWGTPLMHAARNNYPRIAKLLIERGADLDIHDKQGDRNAMSYTHYHDFKENSVADVLRNADRIRQQYLVKTQNAEKTASKQSINFAIKPHVSAPKSDIDILPSIHIKENSNSYAVVIGIENYRQKLPNADFATADARIMTEYLTKVMGYQEKNVITLTNENATKGDFEKYFEKWLSNNVEKGSIVFVYYSGHGAPNAQTGDAYLVPYNGDPSFIAETGYSLKRMYEALSKLQAKEIIVALDSCFSGAGGRSVLAKGARPLVMNLQSNIALSRNITVLSASSGEQISSTYDEKGHGLFTYFLLKGIKNEDVIKADGSIKMDDLFGYIKPQVERIARKQFNNEQTPQLIGAKK